MKSIAEKIQKNTSTMIPDQQFLSQEQVATTVLTLADDAQAKILNGKIIPGDRVFYPVKSHILQMPKMEVSTIECIYLCQYTAIKDIEVLDLRKNHVGDEGVEAIALSPLLTKLRDLDLRNNGITRLGVKILAESKTLQCLEKVDLRLNKLGKRWEEKFNEAGNFKKLNQIKTI